MRSLFKTILRTLSVIGGAALIVLGLVLWLTPVVPGLGLVFVGLPLVLSGHPRGKAIGARWRRSVQVRTRLARRWLARRGRWRSA